MRRETGWVRFLGSVSLVAFIGSLAWSLEGRWVESIAALVLALVFAVSWYGAATE